MIDRQPTKPNRVKITLDDGQVLYGTLERADEPTVVGTALNKANLFDDRASTRYGVETPNEALNLLGRDVDVDVKKSGWSSSTTNGYYTNKVTVEGVQASHTPIFGLAATTADKLEAAKTALAVIERMTTYDGYVVFLASEIPDDDVKIRIKGV